MSVQTLTATTLFHENREGTVLHQELRGPAAVVSKTFSKRLLDDDNATDLDLSIATQKALLLHGPYQHYTLKVDHAVPTLHGKDEVLVKVLAIGLNPIDWKGPAYNFGIPTLPWINGRDFAGVVVRVSDDRSKDRLQVGDIVLAPSTDYRDVRKAAFQEYAVTTQFNAARIPESSSIYGAASLGVAYVASALALGISFGLDFSAIPGLAKGPNLLKIVRGLDEESIPQDIREECLAIDTDSSPRPGDWIAIWGASTTTGYLTLQLAKLAGLKTICVADIARHGARLSRLGADILVDRHDEKRAVEIIRGVTDGQLRFAVDIVGKDTAEILQQALSSPSTPSNADDKTSVPPQQRPHLLGLTGLPKTRDSAIQYHTVPIKLFHESPAVGEALVIWLEHLLLHGSLQPPETVNELGGLGGINDALQKLRAGSVSGKRIVLGLEDF